MILLNLKRVVGVLAVSFLCLLLLASCNEIAETHISSDISPSDPFEQSGESPSADPSVSVGHSPSASRDKNAWIPEGAQMEAPDETVTDAVASKFYNASDWALTYDRFFDLLEEKVEDGIFVIGIRVTLEKGEVPLLLQEEQNCTVTQIDGKTVYDIGYCTYSGQQLKDLSLDKAVLSISVYECFYELDEFLC